MHRILDHYRGYRFPTGPIVLSDEYRLLIEFEESHPDNQDGADKTWVERADASCRSHYDSIDEE